MQVIEVKPEEIEKFHALKPDHLFTSKAWCDCVGEKLKRFFIVNGSHEPVGGFVAYEGGKFGCATLITPPYTPHIGLFATESRNSHAKENTFRKALISAIAEFVKSSRYIHVKLDFSPEWTDMQPMIWNKISVIVRYTYRLDLAKSDAELLEAMDSKTRNILNKAKREGAYADYKEDVSLGLKMLLNNFNSNNLKPHSQILENVLRYAALPGKGIWTKATHNGQVIAITISVNDATDSFNMLSAINREAKQNFGGAFSLYSSILKAKEQKLQWFDFEGSSVPEIESFFRSFGGVMTPYYSIRYDRWPWKILFRLMKK